MVYKPWQRNRIYAVLSGSVSCTPLHHVPTELTECHSCRERKSLVAPVLGHAFVLPEVHNHSVASPLVHGMPQ